MFLERGDAGTLVRKVGASVKEDAPFSREGVEPGLGDSSTSIVEMLVVESSVPPGAVTEIDKLVCGPLRKIGVAGRVTGA